MRNKVIATALALVLGTGTWAYGDLIYQNGFEINESPYTPAFPDVSGSPGFVILPFAAPATGNFFIGPDVGVQRQIDPALDPAAPEGTQYLFIGNNGFFSNAGTDQAIGQDGVISYTFSVRLGTRNRENGPVGNGNVDVDASGITIGIEDLTGATSINTLPIVRGTLPLNGFADFSVVLPGATVAAGDVLRLFIDKGQTAVAQNDRVNLIVADDIRVNTVVPEPASMSLLALGAAALIRRRR